ncbi:MAG: hypothetical protein JW810_09240 [Sedimentisphaerales bacterium]|nr:hypothetical protein [Sedimentisphaerales bacterium]
MDQEQEQTPEETLPDRRSAPDRRRGLPDTRPLNEQVERRSGWDRRRGPGRRRTDERRSAEEGEMTDEQFEFLMAIKEYKTANKVSFPTFTEILEIAKALGYRKVAEPEPIRTLRKKNP